MFFGARAPRLVSSLVFSYVQREREEKSSRLRASAFFNRRHIRRVHRRAKKLNLSYFRLRRVALIRLHEQRDRSDVFEQRLRCSEEKERNGQYRDTSAYRYTQEYASYSNKKAQSRKREETILIKADKNKTNHPLLFFPAFTLVRLLISPGPTPSHFPP